jgi:hypothetical protein
MLLRGNNGPLTIKESSSTWQTFNHQDIFYNIFLPCGGEPILFNNYLYLLQISYLAL